MPPVRRAFALVVGHFFQYQTCYLCETDIQEILKERNEADFLPRIHAAYGIDARRIGAFGGSAGGHLIALLGTSDPSSGLEGSCGYSDQSSRVQAVADLYGPADLVIMFDGIRGLLLPLVFGTIDANSEIVSGASPVTHVTSDDPPFLILHGDKDTLVRLSQSEILYERLVAAEIPATLVVVKNGAHGFRAEGSPMTPTWDSIIDMIADFFDQHLK